MERELDFTDTQIIELILGLPIRERPPYIKEALKRAGFVIEDFANKIELPQHLKTYFEDFTENDFVGCTASQIYSDYLDFCKNEYITPMSKKAFCFKVNKVFRIKSVPRRNGAGGQERIYIME